MATYWIDPIYGDNANAGTSEGSPKKTVAAAVSVLSSGTHIVYMLPGIYREQLLSTIPASNVRIMFIGLGSAVVDGEGIRTCINYSASLSQSYSAVSASVQAAGIPRGWSALFKNIRFRNPVGTTFLPASTDGYYTPSDASLELAYSYAFVNCTFWWDTQPGGTSQVFTLTITGHPGNVNNVSGFGLHCFANCTFKNMTRVLTISVTGASGNLLGNRPMFVGCIVDVSDATDPFLSWSVSGGITDMVTALLDYGNARPGAGSLVNLTTTAPPYTDATFPNPDLSLDYGHANIGSYRGVGGSFIPTSPTGTGPYGTTGGRNIGAHFHPAFGVDTVWHNAIANTLATDHHMDELGSSAVNDPNYPDGSTQGTAVRVADAAFGDHWEIDTLSNPSALSAAIAYPVYYVPVRTGSTAYLKFGIREAEEDTAPASGSKEVIDSTQAGSGRTWQYRKSTTTFAQTASSPSWTDVDFTTDPAVAFTASSYIQMRLIFRTNGT